MLRYAVSQKTTILILTVVQASESGLFPLLYQYIGIHRLTEAISLCNSE
jgi:hypothetical protein